MKTRKYFFSRSNLSTQLQVPDTLLSSLFKKSDEDHQLVADLGAGFGSDMLAGLSSGWISIVEQYELCPAQMTNPFGTTHDTVIDFHDKPYE